MKISYHNTPATIPGHRIGSTTIIMFCKHSKKTFFYDLEVKLTITLTYLINEDILIREQGDIFKILFIQADPNQQADLQSFTLSSAMNMILNKFYDDMNKFKGLAKNMTKKSGK